MKFHQWNTALHFLADVGPERLDLDPKSCESALAFIREELPALRPAFRERIRYTGVPFICETNKGFRQLIAALPKDPIEESGTWIVRIPGLDLWTMFYQLSVSPLLDGGWEGEVTVVNVSHATDSEGIGNAHLTREGIRGISVGRLGKMESGLSLPVVVENLIHLILFTRYWNWETEVIPAWGQGIYHNDLYVNNSAFPVEVMESAWLAELIRSEAFASGSRAGGYFRMQRSGPALTRRKLVWVSKSPKHR